ncbi:chitinase [Saprolegnia diclina VS20]|uniref:chitinase n=1 Tax=Saprolegnia diclina (strain VS20) TaxID=1156394 RepID=T0QR53_SAPDV|nr:chitinase [Saprolegnia diclina VS20]EQC37231.1 chitinase [Saprolegnia diclina VS20]|eukprot:XP_008609393.1 chitinase [Saprolegnia diclina VS20]
MNIVSVLALAASVASATQVHSESYPWVNSVQNKVATHPLVGYWHNFPNPSGATYPLSQISKDWDVINIAFASSLGQGKVGFELDPAAGSEEQFIKDVAALKAAGKTIVLSLGGQDGAVSLSDATETANFVSSVHGILTKYGFDGIDLDLENGVSQGLPIINNLISGVKQLKQKIGDSFYLSMAPEHPYVQGGHGAYGGIWGAYLPIIDGLRNELTQIHVQYYNNGGFVYTDGRTLNEGTVDCLVGGSLMLIEGFQTNYGAGWKFNGLRPDQVSFGVPSGPKSAGRGFVTPETVKRTLTCLVQGVGCDTIKPKTTYPTYRGVMTWSINWDSYDGYAFSKPVRQALDGLGGGGPAPTPTASPVTPAPTASPTPTSVFPTVTPAPVTPTVTPTPVPSTSAPKPSCGACTNCYYAPTDACFVGWTAAQCATNSAFKWCGN